MQRYGLVAAMLVGLGITQALAQYPDANEEIARQAEEAAAAPAPVTLKCTDGTMMSLGFGRALGHATLDAGAIGKAALIAQAAGSGIHYSGGGWDVRGKGAEHIVTGPDGTARTCLAQN